MLDLMIYRNHQGQVHIHGLTADNKPLPAILMLAEAIAFAYGDDAQVCEQGECSGIELKEFIAQCEDLLTDDDKELLGR